MDNHRRSSIVEPTSGFGETRNQFNTTVTLAKPQQQRAPEFGPRQPRPEFYQQQQQQQGPYGGGTPNQRPPVGQQQQQQQRPPPRTPGDKSPWNVIRQNPPAETAASAAIRGPLPPPQQLQRPPYYNMQQQRPPPPPQEQQQQQQFRQQGPPQVGDRRPTLGRIEDRPPPFRPENGRPLRPVSSGGGGDDDDEVVVVNSNQQPPSQIRRESVANRPEGESSNRQWPRPSVVSGLQNAAASYGKPSEPYGSRQQPTTIAEGQEQRYQPPAATPYGRQPAAVVLQDGQKARGEPQQPLIRRNSVLQDGLLQPKAAGRIDLPPATEYGRRPPPPSSELQEDKRPPEYGGGGGRRPLLPDQEEAKRTEYGSGVRKMPDQEDVRRQPDYKANRSEVAADYGGKPVTSRDEPRRTSRDYEQQQPRNYEQRKVSLEKPQEPLSPRVEHGNRASELRKSHFEATHLKPVKEQQQYGGRTTAAGGGGRDPRAVETDAMTANSKDYYTSRHAKPSENEPIAIDRNRSSVDDGRNRDELYSKNPRPDTLKIVKDNEPLKDSSNSKGNHRSDDVGKSPSKIPKKDRSELKTPTRRATTPKSPVSVLPTGQKKLPMNKIQVGSAPSPNLKVVHSKIGSLQNTSHKPGGGQVKIENRKLEWKAGTRIEAKNDAYVPGGGDKKIQSVKLQWNAKPKVGSLDNKTHKPGGGDKKIETVKLDFKDKAKPKIGSKDNIKHTPGGGDVKSQSSQLLEKESNDIEDQKLEIKAQSKVGSLDNVKYKPGGGEVKIFDDKSYIKQSVGQMGTPTKSQLQRSSSMKSPTSMKLFSPDERPKSQVKIVVTPTSDEDLHTKIATDTNKGGPRRSANSRSPSLQSDMVIPEEEAVRTLK